MKNFSTQKLFVIIVVLFYSNTFSLFSQENYKFKHQDKSYEIVLQKKTWLEAAEYAKSKSGYLTHIESKEEQEAIWDALVNGAKLNSRYVVVNDGGGIGYVWIGANDFEVEGKWVWDGANTGIGINFWNGNSSSGKAVGNSYVNWGGASRKLFKEPDDYGGRQDAAAIGLEPWPRDMGANGVAGEWNDISESNALYFIVEYDFSDKPDKSAVPSGETSLCQGTKTSDYLTDGAKNGINYLWTLAPTNAGNIVADGKNAVIEWNSNFYGQALLSVKAINPLGEGEESNALAIDVIARPVKPESINGSKEICKDDVLSEYNVEFDEGTLSYIWKLTPDNAGVVIENQNKTNFCEVQWNEDFTGIAILAIKGVNSCGRGDEKSIEIIKSNIPAIPNMPEGEQSLDVNSGKTNYTVLDVDLASKYIWSISPEEAGTISGETTTAEVVWSESFIGTAEIKVAAGNYCGVSDFSTPLSVIVSDMSSVNEPVIHKVNIYPNPSNGLFYIELSYGEKSQITVSNILGKIILSDETEDTNYSFELNTQGIHFLTVSNKYLSKTIIIIKD